jgi:hypothetical protein
MGYAPAKKFFGLLRLGNTNSAEAEIYRSSDQR